MFQKEALNNAWTYYIQPAMEIKRIDTTNNSTYNEDLKASLLIKSSLQNISNLAVPLSHPKLNHSK